MQAQNSHSNLRGAALMTVSMAGYTFNDVCMKLLAGDLPLYQAVFLRGIFATVFLYLLGRSMGAIRFDLPRRDWGLIALRTIGELGATYCFLTALFNMPIANITAILQALPLTVALAAALFLNEPLGWRRLGAILIGFVGVLLIVQPGGDGFTTWSLYGLIAVGFITLRDLAARRLSPGTPSMMVSLVAAVAICIAAGVASLSDTWAPVGLWEAGLLGLAAGFILMGYVASVAVMRVGEISFVAPFRYTGLLWALLLGWLFWGDWPDLLTMIGAGIVVAMGVFTIYRERLNRRRALAQQQ
ncbi:DMT family transporter [Aliiroseovarius subalbicans]|uniref:DMT family transporter n=1 Tax=Aliiroseovarius subalbicans TaxID=2925840 RepID=UPI001F5AA5E1|nr:DMT family transporter [Aliiroseovarius subalbicans]MCI2399678.1 DMT family transporter [Aliiroseovarius subalbicans]